MCLWVAPTCSGQDNVPLYLSLLTWMRKSQPKRLCLAFNAGHAPGNLYRPLQPSQKHPSKRKTTRMKISKNMQCFPWKMECIKMNSRPSQESSNDPCELCSDSSDSRGATCELELYKITDDLLSHILHNPKNLSICPS